MREYLRAEVAEKEARLAELEARDQGAAPAARPERGPQRDRRDPRHRRRRRGEPLGRRPVPHVPALRRASWPEDRGAVEPAVGSRRVPRRHVPREGRRRVGPDEVRGRPAPRAARARDREPGPRSHERGDGRGACPKPKRSTSRSIPTTSRSTCSARRVRAASRSTPPTPRCASRTSRPGSSSSCQDEKSQLQNKDKAMRILRARLLQAEQERQQAEVTAGAPRSGQGRRAVGEDPHVQLQGQSRHRPPHRPHGALARPCARRRSRRGRRRARRRRTRAPARGRDQR